MSTALVLVLSAVTIRAQQPQPLVEPSNQTKVTRTFRVFGPEDRQPIGDAWNYPWSTVGMIDARWGPDGGYQARTGTGVMIGDHVVLTCGHVVHDRGIGSAGAIYFIPGKNGAEEPFGYYAVSTLLVHPSWSADFDDDYDIALLALTRPAGREVSHMDVASQGEGFFADRLLNMTGYPGDLVWDQLYNGTGLGSHLDGKLLVHYIDGGPGQSGGPIWYENETTNRPTVVAVYTGDVDVTENGFLVDSYGVGVYISDELCDWVNAFLREYDEQDSTACTAEGTPAALCGVGAVGPMMVTMVLLMGWGRRRG